MKTRCNIIFIAFILILIFPIMSSAQDPHLSQYDAFPLLLNPSSTGMLDYEYRLTTQYRNQWSAVLSPISTTALAFDMPLKDRWGVGGYIMNNDVANAINAFNFVLSVACKITSPAQKKHLLTVGLQGGFIYKKIGQLLFDNQYSGGNFDSDLPSGEAIEINSVWMPDVNYGISYISIDEQKRFRPYAGFSIFHVTYPKESFLESDDSHLPLRFMLNGGAKIELNESLILEPKFLLMKQRNATELLGGLDAYYRIKNSEINLIGGIHYRLRDAVIMTFGGEHKNFLFKISYDYTVSTLQTYNNGKGAIEFSLAYTVKI